MLLILAVLAALVAILLGERSKATRVQRRAERALLESESRTHALLKALPDLMFVLDRNGTYLEFYAGGESKLFVSPDQFLGKRFEQVLPPEVTAAIMPGFAQVTASGEPATVEYQLPMPDGPRCYEMRMVHLRPDKVLSIVRDLTSAKQAESALRESKHFAERLAATIPNVIFLYDLETRRNVYVNERSAAVIGYTAEEVVAMGDQFLRLTMHPDDLPRLSSLADEYARAKEGEILERVFRFRHKNGEWRWIHRCATVFARNGDGSPRQVLGTATDITALKRTERELQALSTRLLHSQDDERRRIAGELHDGTAQVLFGIGATVASLRQASGVPPEAAAALGECQRLCDEGLSQLRLLTYLLHPPLLDEVDLIAALRWFAEGFSRRSGIDIRLDAPDAMERLPLALERDLFRVIQEALGNVARHSGSSSAVIRLEQQSDRVVLQVRDFGRGIPSPGNSDRHPPPGVGIPSMRERLRHCGGRLDIESGAGGTTVTAVAPFRSEDT